MSRFLVWISFELVVLGGSVISSPSPREIPLALDKQSSEANGPESAILADAKWTNYERNAAELKKIWVWKGKDHPEGGPISHSEGVDSKDHGIISKLEDEGKKSKDGGQRGLGDLERRDEGSKRGKEFPAEHVKRLPRLFWVRRNSTKENHNLQETRDEFYARLDPADGDAWKESTLVGKGGGEEQLRLRRRRSLRKTREEALRAKSRRRKHRSKGESRRQRRLTDEDVMDDDEDELDQYFEGFNKRKDRAAAKPNAAGPELIPPHDVIPLDGPTPSQPSELDQYPSSSPASSDGDTVKEPISPYGNMNASYVPNDVADFASKLQNPTSVRQFYHEYSLLANFPRETISWDEPDLVYDCWVQAMLVGRFPYAPSCEVDGTYTRKQCYLQRCWCVHPDGQPVVKDHGERFYYKMAAVNLKCLPPTKRTTPKGSDNATTTPVGPFFNLNQTNQLADAANQTETNSSDNQTQPTDSTDNQTEPIAITDNQTQPTDSTDNQTQPTDSTDNQTETNSSDNQTRPIANNRKHKQPISWTDNQTQSIARSDNQFETTVTNTDNPTVANTDNPSSPTEPTSRFANQPSPIKPDLTTGNHYETNPDNGNQTQTTAGTDKQSQSTVANTDNPTAPSKPNTSSDNPPNPIIGNPALPIEPNQIVDNPPLPIEPNPIIDNPPLLIESI